MTTCFFAADLHGRVDRYEKLFRAMEAEPPRAVFLGGDLLPHYGRDRGGPDDFLGDFVSSRLESLRGATADRFPSVFVIMGNDDPRVEEGTVIEIAERGLWRYAHGRRFELGRYRVYGYSFVPPTPFLLKDWEKYDVSRYTPPGSVSPEHGRRSVPVEPREIRYSTIAQDLHALAGDDDVTDAVFLFHSPPHETTLDRAALDGKTIEHVPLDLHVGSIAVRRFVEQRQPLVTLHGHIHESTRLTGRWRERIGRTHAFNAAHDGPELALVTFDLDNPADATRELL
jgi:Icc-related predicted phosphoesterase